MLKFGGVQYHLECVPVDSSINVPAEKKYQVYLQRHSFLVAMETAIRAILYLADKPHIFWSLLLFFLFFFFFQVWFLFQCKMSDRSITSTWNTDTNFLFFSVKFSIGPHIYVLSS